MDTITIRPVFRSMPLQIDCLFRSGTKGAVLYIEGMGCSMSDFAPAFTHPALKDYTLAAFDFPGMGTSPYPCGSHLDIDDLAEVTDTAASALGLERFVIAGHSMGGAVALLYAEKYRPRTAGFINIEGNLAAEDCFFSRKIAQLNSADQVKRELQKLMERLSRAPEKGLQAYAASLKQASAQACLDYSRPLVDYSDRGDLLGRYTALDIPTIFIYGEQNHTLSYLPLLKGHGCRTVEIAGGGHFLFHDNPEAFYRETARFLKEVYP